MFGLLAVTVAPLIGLPESSLTKPLTRPTCAAASPANKALRTNATTTCQYFARIVNTPEAAQKAGVASIYATACLEQPGGLVQEDVDEDAGYRNVEPDRQCPAGDRAMGRETAPQASRQGQD